MRRDLVERSVELCRMLRRLLPARPGRGRAAGAAAAHRRPPRDPHRPPTAGCCCSRSRTAPGGTAAAIAEGAALVREALRARPPGRYALQAAIAAVHAESPTLGRHRLAARSSPSTACSTQLWPSPVVALNRAVAVGFACGADAGLAALDALAGEPQLAGYGYLPAARADFLRRLGRVDEAREAYTEALFLTENAVERNFLTARLQALGPGPTAPCDR